MDFSKFKVEKKVNPVIPEKETIKETVKGKPLKRNLDPSLAAYPKVFQTCTTCDDGTTQDLIGTVAVCKKCGHKEPFSLPN